MSKATSSVDILDKCNRLQGLMQCLTFVVDSDFKSYIRSPHHDLILTIGDVIQEIYDGVVDVCHSDRIVIESSND